MFKNLEIYFYSRIDELMNFFPRGKNKILGKNVSKLWKSGHRRNFG